MTRLTTVEKSDVRVAFFAFYGNIPWQRILLSALEIWAGNLDVR